MTKEMVEAAKQTLSSDAVQEKVLNMLDSLQHGAVMVGQQVVKYSPDIAETALWIVRLDGMQAVMTAVLFLPAAYYFAKWAKRFYAYLKEENDLDEPVIVGVGLLWGAAIVCAFKAAEVILNIWTWASIFAPKLWLAKRIIDTALNQ